MMMRSSMMSPVERAVLIGGVALLGLGLAQSPGAVDEDPVVVALRAELERASVAWAAREAQLVAQVASLRAELSAAEESRVAREREWLVWTRAISQLAPVGVVEVPDFEIGLSAEELALLIPAEALSVPRDEVRDEARLARSEEIERMLRTLMRLEWVDGLNLLEAGLLSDEGWTGPCVFRLIGADGRAVGSVSAERLHLEGSVTGRTLTMVLTEGYERRAGDLLPFEGSQQGERRGGERRIVLVRTDPRPWMEALPELFREREQALGVGTAGVNLAELRRGVNRLLSEDAAGGRWRLEACSGLGTEGLSEVDLVDLDEDGRTRRHLFADRMVIERRKTGVVLVLRDGVQMRGGRKTPFLEGRFRIFLPRARHAGWEEVGLLEAVVAAEAEAPVESGSDADAEPDAGPAVELDREAEADSDVAEESAAEPLEQAGPGSTGSDER